MILEGRKLLVTGAQQGIGAAVALRAAEAGADVALNYLDDEAATRAIAETITGMGRKAVLVRGDVTDIGALPDMVAQAAEGLGGLDLLCNNAGIYPRQPILELEESIWDATLTVNLKANAFLSKAFALHCKAAGCAGAIVSMSSLAVQGWQDSAHYCASKSGIIGLTRTLAIELAPLNIRANAIAPGLIDTAQPRGGYTEEQLKELVAGTLAGRWGTADEVAETTVYLLSDTASFVNGQLIHVNGGAFFS
ncbi:SDR family NAD(P)-dependent oxidoreductase [Allosediminivita pacifica]|uniref:Gluconate 5-dehydrogenase/3-oxoacyl-[acyl-carrier protein] reductase/L-rhamnose 1-dehydrogenase n=1 Tax=Allosediminivita pacifica TaxID=1267769 RepID=A0A2T6AU19_9RHOB|nr:SDR family NAD(P)-dependent oxidoreductase [Allosediminivita pacifica]PTX47226.1 gluconate 5-dehydrogenase/3-oxoacyl-[acyl-carrier protein] reductase/L-rhamnose 1-dehydrogenase [Allosediminivita pacifica]GGB09282.1 2-deoxy-D-gluconate 3-dehydrogenase [Allosediminivita pacifica]